MGEQRSAVCWDFRSFNTPNKMKNPMVALREATWLGETQDHPQSKIWQLNNLSVLRYFRCNERKTNILIEIRAGFVTFLALAYILSINANIIASSGGPCTSEGDCTGPDKSFSCRFTDPGFQSCVDETRKNLITATAASTTIACFVMGALGNMPLAISTGMGLNAYFTYNVVGYYGTGSVKYQDALAAIFIEGWIFIILSVTGARQYLIKLLPRTLALSMSAGIGMFLAFIGLQGSEGIGAVAADGATLVTLGGCPTANRVPSYFISDADLPLVCNPPAGEFAPYTGPKSDNFMCLGHKMESATLWLGLAGLAITTILMSRGFRGSIIVGILFVTFISWIPGSAVSYLGHTSSLTGGIGGDGESRWQYFKKVVAAPSLSRTSLQLDFAGLGNGDVWIALVTFLYVDFCDCTGTLFSMANYLDTYLPGFVDPETKDFPRSTLAYCSDGVGIVVGSLMGTSPLTVFIESATGIREGGRTGLTACMTGFCFFIALFFAPLLASIPVFATGPALILVGSLMMLNAAKVQWNDITKAVPAFLTIVIMPLTYSIAYGVIAGIVSYFIAYFTTRGLDFLSSKTNGAFGWHNPHEDIDGPETREVTFHLKNNPTAGSGPGADDSSEDSQAGKINNHMAKNISPV